MNLVIFGAPGAGKGTQSALLVSELGYRQISTGDLLRKAVREGSSLGLEAKSLMDRGQLVPDEVVLGLVRESLGTLNGVPFILDGFPRNLSQLSQLQSLLSSLGLKLSRAVFLSVDSGLLVERLSGRRVCSKCGSVYHLIAKPPRTPGECDLCGAPLSHRPDDKEGVIRDRLGVYNRDTAPLKDEFRKLGILAEVDAGRPETVVFAAIRSHLGK